MSSSHSFFSVVSKRNEHFWCYISPSSSLFSSLPAMVSFFLFICHSFSLTWQFFCWCCCIFAVVFGIILKNLFSFHAPPMYIPTPNRTLWRCIFHWSLLLLVSTPATGKCAAALRLLPLYFSSFFVCFYIIPLSQSTHRAHTHNHTLKIQNVRQSQKLILVHGDIGVVAAAAAAAAADTHGEYKLDVAKACLNDHK